MVPNQKKKKQPDQLDTALLYRSLETFSIPKKTHKLQISDFDTNAISIIKKLEQRGFQALIVGGAIRDLLCGIKPKDFDIATNATPEQVHSLFPNSRIIGRRFRIAHILFGRHIIEIATFRGEHEETQDSKHSRVAQTGQLLRDNIFGSIEEDAQRRDFSANALYYSPSTENIYDFTKGFEHIANKQLVLLGNPAKRFKEDPVRMLRAFRFSNKLGFTLEKSCLNEISENKALIRHVSNARLFDESIKLFHNEHNVELLKDLQNIGLFQQIFPMFHETDSAQKMLILALENTRQRLLIGKPVTIAYIYAVLLWSEFMKRCARFSTAPSEFHQLGNKALSLLREQSTLTMIPKRHAYAIKEIWEYQFRLDQRRANKVIWLMQQRRFRAAFDFLLLREQSGDSQLSLGQWWHDIQIANHEQQQLMIRELEKGNKQNPRKHRKPKHRKKHNAQN